MEILNRREQIKAAAIPPEIANPTTLVTTSDKATKNKARIVKIGDGINVSNGVISVAGGVGNNIFVIPTPEAEQKTREMTSDELSALIVAINEFISGTKSLIFKYIDGNGVLWAISNFEVADYDVTVPAEPEGNIYLWFYDGSAFNALSINLSTGLFIYSE